MSMDLATFQALLAVSGQQALADAMALEPTEARFLVCFEKLRKRHPAPLAKAAIEAALLRIKARSKFESASKMYFTREALEQASSDHAATHRAKRFVPFGVVADLCCGIGSDSLAFARAGLTVHAVDLDSLRLAMTGANAAAFGLKERIHLREDDALTIPLPDVQAAFADPTRRANGRRYLDPEDYTPPLSAIRERFSADFPLAVKIAPGVASSNLTELRAEVEFVSVEGELKECVVWFGSLRTTGRRATLLPAGVTLFADNPIPMPPLAPAQEYVFDPDPAIVRAGLASQLATELGVSPLDHTVALFTGHEATRSPFLTTFTIERATPFHAGRLRDHLRAKRVGRVTAIKRGSTVDTEKLMKSLKLVGEEHRVIILARIGGEETMFIGERA
ncbi:MAG TPA: class I SAM-dependent methyltransferase [Gemmata sp.]|jgi:SAM-dependent methyltransferase|nr:class I SAM-dependent methyltransferase [Gemmata sp.]